MEYKEIKKLIDDMGNSRLSEMEIEFPDGTKISLKKQDSPVEVVASEPKQEEETEECNIVKSPMVGTFYSKPSPTSDAFVNLGSVVKKGDKLCIIEAMKLMNEIESEFDGEIIEIYVKDGEMVDYGKPLFKIK